MTDRNTWNMARIASARPLPKPFKMHAPVGDPIGEQHASMGIAKVLFAHGACGHHVCSCKPLEHPSRARPATWDQMSVCDALAMGEMATVDGYCCKPSFRQEHTAEHSTGCRFHPANVFAHVPLHWVVSCNRIEEAKAVRWIADNIAPDVKTELERGQYFKLGMVTLTDGRTVDEAGGNRQLQRSFYFHESMNPLPGMPKPSAPTEYPATKKTIPAWGKAMRGALATATAAAQPIGQPPHGLYKTIAPKSVNRDRIGCDECGGLRIHAIGCKREPAQYNGY